MYPHITRPPRIQVPSPYLPYANPKPSKKPKRPFKRDSGALPQGAGLEGSLSPHACGPRSEMRAPKGA